MIKVAYLKTANSVQLRVKGHANSGPYGHDLVCAAVSAILTGGLNTLTHPGRYAITSNDGFVELTSDEAMEQHDLTVLETMLRQLETLAEAHPQSVQITLKGS